MAGECSGGIRVRHRFAAERGRCPQAGHPGVADAFAEAPGELATTWRMADFSSAMPSPLDATIGTTAQTLQRASGSTGVGDLGAQSAQPVVAGLASTVTPGYLSAAKAGATYSVNHLSDP